MRLKFVFWAEVSRINKQQSIGKVIPVSNINLQLFWYQFISILLGNLWSIPTMKAFPIFLYQLSELLENIWSWKWRNPVLSDMKTINQSLEFESQFSQLWNHYTISGFVWMISEESQFFPLWNNLPISEDEWMISEESQLIYENYEIISGVEWMIPEGSQFFPLYKLLDNLQCCMNDIWRISVFSAMK